MFVTNFVLVLVVVFFSRAGKKGGPNSVVVLCFHVVLYPALIDDDNPSSMYHLVA